MTKTMELFIQLRDTGVAVTLANLDELYEKEMRESKAALLTRIRQELGKIGMDANTLNLSESIVKEFQAGITAGINVINRHLEHYGERR